MKNGLVLSLFPGADLFGMGFEREGFCVVRGPDKIWGGDVANFFPSRYAFEGIIGGPPCPDWSGLLRTPPSGVGVETLYQFIRIIAHAKPDWFVMENVVGVPDIEVPGYSIQRFNLCPSECGGKSTRNRAFQFGHWNGLVLVPERQPRASGLSRIALATEGKKQDRRSWAEFCAVQGLPPEFDMPGLSREAKYRAVGNGVHVDVARVIARAVKSPRSVTEVRLCVCQCGRICPDGRTMATAACRQRMKRRRDTAGVTGPGIVTGAASQLELVNVTLQRPSATGASLGGALSKIN